MTTQLVLLQFCIAFTYLFVYFTTTPSAVLRSMDFRYILLYYHLYGSVLIPTISVLYLYHILPPGALCLLHYTAPTTTFYATHTGACTTVRLFMRFGGMPYHYLQFPLCRAAFCLCPPAISGCCPCLLPGLRFGSYLLLDGAFTCCYRLYTIRACRYPHACLGRATGTHALPAFTTTCPYVTTYPPPAVLQLRTTYYCQFVPCPPGPAARTLRLPHVLLPFQRSLRSTCHYGSFTYLPTYRSFLHFYLRSVLCGSSVLYAALRADATFPGSTFTARCAGSIHGCYHHTCHVPLPARPFPACHYIITPYAGGVPCCTLPFFTVLVQPLRLFPVKPPYLIIRSVPTVTATIHAFGATFVM